MPASPRCRGEEVRRFCELIDPGHAAYDPEYIETLRAMGRRERPGPRAEVVEAMARLRAMHACAFRSIEIGCGCSGARCALRRGEIVSHADCFDCVRRYG